MNRIPSPGSLGLLAALALSAITTGCSNGISARIAEKSSVFAQLPAEAQKNIRDGIVEPGYTADMVYMALGKPSRVEVRDTAHGKVGFWIYANSYPQGYQTAASAEPAAKGNESVTTVTTTNAVSPDTDATRAPSAGAVASDTPEHSTYSDHSVLGKPAGRSYQAVERNGQRPFQANSSTFSDRSAAMEPLDIPDMESASLYVVFFEGRVARMSLTRH